MIMRKVTSDDPIHRGERRDEDGARAVKCIDDEDGGLGGPKASRERETKEKRGTLMEEQRHRPAAGGKGLAEGADTPIPSDWNASRSYQSSLPSAAPAVN